MFGIPSQNVQPKGPIPCPLPYPLPYEQWSLAKAMPGAAQPPKWAGGGGGGGGIKRSMIFDTAYKDVKITS